MFLYLCSIHGGRLQAPLYVREAAWQLGHSRVHVRCVLCLVALACLLAYAFAAPAGHVRLFDTGSASLVAEVAAHARCITALDVHPVTDMVRVAPPVR